MLVLMTTCQRVQPRVDRRDAVIVVVQSGTPPRGAHDWPLRRWRVAIVAASRQQRMQKHNGLGSFRVQLFHHELKLVSHHVPLLPAAKVVGPYEHEECSWFETGGQQAMLEPQPKS